MGVLDNTNDALTKAAEKELEWLNSGKEDKQKKKAANLYFKRAMKLDGNDDYEGNVIE